MRRNTNSQLSTRSMLLMVRLLCAVALFGFTYCSGTQDAFAQFDGGDVPADGGFGDGGFPADGGDSGAGDDGGGDFGGGDGGGDTGDADFGEGEDLGGLDMSDQRNQGFVGSTGTTIQDSGFVGPPGEESGPPLAEGAGFGGGTNNVGTGGGGGGGGGGGNNQNRNAGFGGTGQQKGFEVFRSSVRANLRSRFSSPVVNGFQVADRFQNRIRRLPNTAGDGTGVQISISNQTATIQGFVGSAEEMNRIERQLRLEPGVYRIQNQSRVIGQ